MKIGKKYSPSLWLATTKIMAWRELEQQEMQYVENGVEFIACFRSYLVEEKGHELDGKFVIDITDLNCEDGFFDRYVTKFLYEMPNLDEWIGMYFNREHVNIEDWLEDKKIKVYTPK